ncbi:MAG: roadblock/LC7 domain-containing protein [Longimicrobiaceae bacterium]
MRRGDLDRYVADLAGPVDSFVADTRVRLVLLINRSGQVLAQRGFARALDVIEVASLGAAIHASSGALAEILGQPGFEHLHQQGGRGQTFIGSFRTPSEDLVLIAVFREDSSLGLVRTFFDTLVRRVAELPGWRDQRPGSDPESFERDLQAGLEKTFGSGEREESSN